MAEDTSNKEIQKEKKKLPIKTLIILLLVFFMEGGAISLFFVMKGGPKPAQATDPIEQTQQDTKNQYGEVTLAEDFQVDNYMLGRSRMIVTLEVAATVETKNKEKLTQQVTEHKKEIQNAIRVLVASAQPDQIKDPKLEVIKREIKAAVEKIVDEGLINQILLPTWHSQVIE